MNKNKEEEFEQSDQREDKQNKKTKIITGVVLFIIFLSILGGGLYLLYLNDSSENTHLSSFTFTIRSNTSVQFTFGTYEPIPPKPTDIKVLLKGNESTIEIMWSSTLTGSPFNLSVTGEEGVEAYYTDYDWHDNEINSGDYLMIDGLEPSTKYTVEIYHIPSNSMCPFVGTSSFTTPP